MSKAAGTTSSSSSEPPFCGSAPSVSTKWAHAGGRVTAPTFSLTTGVFFEPDTTSGVWLAQLHGPRAQVNSHQGPGVGVHAGVNHMAVSIRSSDLCGFGLEVGDRDLAWRRPVGGVLLLFFMPVLPARGVQNRALNHRHLSFAERLEDRHHALHLSQGKQPTPCCVTTWYESPTLHPSCTSHTTCCTARHFHSSTQSQRPCCLILQPSVALAGIRECKVSAHTALRYCTVQF